MRKHMIVGAIVTAGLVLGTRSVAAEPDRMPHLRLTGDRQLCKPGEKPDDPPECIVLPPGHYLDEPAWSLLDSEMRRLQTNETRLMAENNYFRKNTSGWQPGWKTIGLSILLGAVTGIAVYRHYE